MNDKYYSSIAALLFWCFVCYCGFISALHVFQRPLIGDDLFYVSDLNVRGGDWAALPHLMAGIYMGSNGRWGEMTNTVWMALLPRVMTAAFAFLFAVLLPWASMKLSGIKIRNIAPVLLLNMIIVFLLPWYDMAHFVCIINYAWCVPIVLACLIPLVGDCRLRSKLWLLGIPLAGMGAAWHEASGVPLAVGLTAWCLWNHKWKQFTTIKKWWFMAMIAGGLFTITSPALWSRVAAKGTADDTAYLLGSVSLTVVLLIVILVVIFTNKTLFDKLLHDRFLVFSVASLVSACIVMVGGVAGRSGIFAQTFAAIAMMRIAMLSDIMHGFSRKAATIAVSLALYCIAAYYVTQSYISQLPVNEKLNEAIAVYPDNHELGYAIVLSVYEEQWEAASLKVYDPKYDSKVDRNNSLKLHAEEEQDQR